MLKSWREKVGSRQARSLRPFVGAPLGTPQEAWRHWGSRSMGTEVTADRAIDHDLPQRVTAREVLIHSTGMGGSGL